MFYAPVVCHKVMEVLKSNFFPDCSVLTRKNRVARVVIFLQVQLLMWASRIQLSLTSTSALIRASRCVDFDTACVVHPYVVGLHITS